MPLTRLSSFPLYPLFPLFIFNCDLGCGSTALKKTESPLKATKKKLSSWHKTTNMWSVSAARPEWELTNFHFVNTINKAESNNNNNNNICKSYLHLKQVLWGLWYLLTPRSMPRTSRRSVSWSVSRSVSQSDSQMLLLLLLLPPRPLHKKPLSIKLEHTFACGRSSCCTSS